MHKFSNFSANNIVISEKNVIFALDFRTNSRKYRLLIQRFR